MNSRVIKYEPLLYGLALIVALVVRFTQLGKAFLSDYEANLALQSLGSLRSSQVLIGSQPAYVQFTTFMFFLFGPGNFVARFFPALMGCLVVVIPAFFRRQLGILTAVALSFFLAIDPGLAGLSRQAGTPIVALAGALLALGLWRNKKPALAGVALGLALMGGEAFWTGLIGLGAAIVIARWRGWQNLGEQEEASEIQAEPARDPYIRLGLMTVGTLILIGSLFFLRPRGLNGIVEGLSAYLQGWGKPSGVSGGSLLLALLAYETAPLLFGMLGALHGWRANHSLDKLLSLWALAAFLVALIYPAHQIGDLVWVAFPLWALAAREVSRYFTMPSGDLVPVLGQAALTVIVLVFTALQLAALTDNTLPKEIQQIHTLTIVGALAFLALTSFLVSWGWSPRVVGRGLTWGAGSFLLLYTIATMTGATALRPDPTAELWDRDARVTQGNLLIQTIDDLSRWYNGFTGSLDLVVAGLQSPSLQWALRDYADTQFVDRLSTGLNPSVVITAQEQPELAASYRGQNLIWSQSPDWSLMLPQEYLPWLVYHTAHERQTSMYLWVRTDIFPGGEFSIPETTTP